MKRVILFGFQNAGKSYWGKKLAESTKTPFIDTDALLADNCRDLYKKIGEKKFRELESQVIQQLQAVSGVIAVGGGAVLNPRNCLHLQSLGALVYLEVSKETLKKRSLERGFPAHLENASSFDQMYEERLALYENWAAYTIRPEEKGEEEILRELKGIMYGK